MKLRYIPVVIGRGDGGGGCVSRGDGGSNGIMPDGDPEKLPSKDD